MNRFFLLLAGLAMTVGLQAKGTVVKDTINGVPCRVYVPVTGYGLQVTGEKFMKDGKLFIRVGETVYDMMGNRVR